ncbi:MAG: sensor histidine kinase [Hydrogenoanaerobacterium sp.]
MKPNVKKIKKMFSSLQFVLTLLMSIFALAAMTAVAVVMLLKFNNTMTENVVTNSSQVVNQVARALNLYIESTIDVSDKIVLELNDYFYSEKQTVVDTLNTAYKLRDDIVSITVFDGNGEVVAAAPYGLMVKDNINITEQEWYKIAQKAPASLNFSTPHVQNIYKGKYNWVVTFSRKLKLYNKEVPGNSVFTMDMNFNSIEENCNSVTLGKRGYVFLLDENNNIIYHPQQQMIYANIKKEDTAFISGKNDGEYIDDSGSRAVIIRTLEHTKWRLVGISYLDELTATRTEVIVFLAKLFGIAVVIVIIIAIMMSRRIAKPIVRLTETMDRVEKGDISVYATEYDGFYEVNRLRRSFNHMIDRINDLLERIKAEEKELRKSELRALQAQINPHFLYNTLGSILWMCESGDGKGAVVMVQALANLFRISISKGNEIITIKDELQHAESYLIIQKVRYKDQFRYSIEADESVLDFRCLKIILQPMIENAIYHGIDRMVDPGEIKIRVKDCGETILMQVIDNGIGMPEAVLSNILESESSNSYGIGIKNVNHRIQIYFGKEYGIRFESEPDVGTTVNITIPKIKGGEAT